LRYNVKAIIWFIGISTVLGFLIVNLEMTIEPEWPWKAVDSKQSTIPNLCVKLRNNGEKIISLPVKGELFLWPPGDYSWDLEGSYKFKYHDNQEIHTDMISIPAKSEQKFMINLTKAAPIHQDMKALKRFFRAGGWHIQFILKTDQQGRNMIYCDKIPFTVDGMSTVYTFGVFEKHLE
jgi:hypothetical protein